MLLNSYLLFGKYSNRKMSLYDFRQSLLCSLLDIQVEEHKKTNTNTRHVLTKISLTEKDGRTKRKRCRECSRNKIQKPTLYHCENCPDNPEFCVAECFNSAHPK